MWRKFRYFEIWVIRYILFLFLHDSGNASLFLTEPFYRSLGSVGALAPHSFPRRRSRCFRRDVSGAESCRGSRRAAASSLGLRRRRRAISNSRKQLLLRPRTHASHFQRSRRKNAFQAVVQRCRWEIRIEIRHCFYFYHNYIGTLERFLNLHNAA